MFKYYIAALKKYATFSGRARRKEYWYFTLINSIISILLSIPIYVNILKIAFSIAPQRNSIPEDTILILNNMSYSAIICYIIILLYGLAVFIPGLAVSVRRLHDVGKSGWFLLIPYLSTLLLLIPIIGYLVYLGLDIWFLVLMFKDSQVGENEYGADPKTEERNI